MVFQTFKHRLTAALLCAALLAASVPMAPAASAVTYTDVQESWAYDSIMRCTEQGLMQGVGGSQFSPQGSMTRAMFVTVLARLGGVNLSSYGGSTFSDVASGSYYAGAVSWAKQAGIVSGVTSTTFEPDRAVARQELAVMFVRYANYTGTALPRTRAGKLFADSSACADYALDAIYTLYRAGIINGRSNDYWFAPAEYATRAECARLLCNYLDATAGSVSAAQQMPLIAHRGYSSVAPENTLPAYELAADKGFLYVETDVQFTKDNVPVLLHDSTIDRTSNGSGKVSSLTYSQLQQYEFGNSSYSAKIPTYSEFLALCSSRGLIPVVELKNSYTAAQIQKIIEISNQYGLTDKILWISFYSSNLSKVIASLPYATVAFLADDATSQAIQTANSLKNGKDTVYISVYMDNLTAKKRATCLRNNLPLITWTTDRQSTAIEQANTSCQMLTTNGLTAQQIYG